MTSDPQADVVQPAFVQAALEVHYGTWRADGDPDWAEVAAVVAVALQAPVVATVYENLTRHEIADVLVDRYWWGGKCSSRIMRRLLHRYADKLDRREARNV